MPVIPSLPQHDPETERRQWGVEEIRNLYDYDHESVSPIPIIKQLAPLEFFSPWYKGNSDRAQMEGGRGLAVGAVAAGSGPLTSLEDYDRLIAGYKRPGVMRGHLMDAYFSEQRVAGLNPMKLERLRELPQAFPFTDEMLALAFDRQSKRTLKEECKAGRLFLADYSDYDDVPSGTSESGSKFLPAPMALFCWREGRFGHRGDLVPIGISVRPGTGAERVVKTPRSHPMHWRLAKLAVQIADSNHHEMSSHLARTHFVMEPFAIATPRQLSFRHPIFVLLRPHLRFTLAQNSYGRDVLLTPGRIVDRLFGATLDGSFSILAKAYESWSFDAFTVPADLETRGLATQQDLPHYPYRDDALLLWGCIRRFVDRYLALYYPNDPQDVLGDTELQSWAAELASADFGRVKGFPARIGTVERLAQILTNIIFTCGPQHAAMNFPQFDYMAHIPNMPLAAYAELPMEGKDADQVWECILPPRDRAIEQIQITYTLTTFRHDRLGHYLESDFRDPRAQEATHAFRLELYDAECAMQAANTRRLLPYPYLQPSLVPNSIAI